MNLDCIGCAKPAAGATAFHNRDGLVRVECDECHARRITLRIPVRVQCIGVALWLMLLVTQTLSVLSHLTPQ
jgi:hypothetical protein